MEILILVGCAFFGGILGYTGMAIINEIRSKR